MLERDTPPTFAAALPLSADDTVCDASDLHVDELRSYHQVHTVSRENNTSFSSLGRDATGLLHLGVHYEDAESKEKGVVESSSPGMEVQIQLPYESQGPLALRSGVPSKVFCLGYRYDQRYSSNFCSV
ncbi:hypothetical protein MKX01_037219 [Papaver californicum]|nr:hypothetical protein MKX01_037219 [Papaver californicum]